MPSIKKATSLVSIARRHETSEQKQKAKKEVVAIEHKIKKKFRVSDLEHFADESRSFHRMKVDKITSEFGVQALQCLPKDYRFSRQLGAGTVGKIFQICRDKFQCLAIKFQILSKKEKPQFEKEIKMQQIFASHGLAPNIVAGPHFFPRSDKKILGCFVMERIDGVLEEILMGKHLDSDNRTKIVGNVLAMLGLLVKYHLTHGDFHDRNIGFRFSLDTNGVLQTQLLLIDFGFSLSGESHLDLECLQLARMLADMDWPYPKENRKAMAEPLHNILKSMYGIKKFDFESLEYEYFERRKEYTHLDEDGQRV